MIAKGSSYQASGKRCEGLVGSHLQMSADGFVGSTQQQSSVVESEGSPQLPALGVIGYGIDGSHQQRSNDGLEGFEGSPQLPAFGLIGIDVPISSALLMGLLAQKDPHCRRLLMGLQAHP